MSKKKTLRIFYASYSTRPPRKSEESKLKILPEQGDKRTPKLKIGCKTTNNNNSKSVLSTPTVNFTPNFHNEAACFMSCIPLSVTGLQSRVE